MGWKLPKPSTYDFSDRSQLKKIFSLFRNDLKKKNFYKKKYLEEFDISKVTDEEVKLVKKILNEHTDMQFGIIQRECNASAWMFIWTQKVLKLYEIKKNMKSTGIKDLEDKISEFKETNKMMTKIFDDVLKNQQFN
jgi:hypothetical protein